MRTCDREEIRRILNRDRVWSIYALADLDPDLFALCEWWVAGDGLALVFSGIAIKPIFVTGSRAAVDELLNGLPCDAGYLNLREEHMPQVHYSYRQPHRMLRMVATDFAPRAGGTVALRREDADEIAALYATGTGAGVAFGAFQLDSGFFRGVRHDGELIAVAGVHVVSRNESVAGVGNVFTREDHRGRGLAQITTVGGDGRQLLEAWEFRTIGLNVEDDNAAAIAGLRETVGVPDCVSSIREGAAVRGHG